MEWEQGSFAISGRWDGKEQTRLMEGVKNDLFGIHEIEEGTLKTTTPYGSRKGKVKGEYVLTHLPSGAAVRYDYPSQEAAMLAADLILSTCESLGVDFTKQEPRKGVRLAHLRQIASASQITANIQRVQTLEEEAEEESEEVAE